MFAVPCDVVSCANACCAAGAEFPWSPYRLVPFAGSATFHSYHHSRNAGNYSSFFTHWDRMMGTMRSYEQYVHTHHKTAAQTSIATTNAFVH